MEYVVSIDERGNKPPIIAELLTCGACRYRVDGRCTRLGVVRPDVEGWDFCSFGRPKCA